MLLCTDLITVYGSDPAFANVKRRLRLIPITRANAMAPTVGVPCASNFAPSWTVPTGSLVWKGIMELTGIEPATY